MKAAVLHRLGTNPKCEDFEDPQPLTDSHVLVSVKAASIKQLDRMKASGKHYTKYPQFPVAVGVDGAGLLEDGTRIYASGISGMMAEKALVEKDRWAVLPDGLDFEIAAALPNALIGSDMALLYRARMQKGETILINGATGVTGKLAVQMAKYRGASTIIVTGRNEAVLKELRDLGADKIIALKQDDNMIIEQLQQIHQNTPIDVVLDYLWGHPTELILQALTKLAPRKIRIVTVGEMAGATIALPSGVLRSSQIEMSGSGIGSITNEDMGLYMREILPKIFQLVVDRKLTVDIETVELKEIETVWLQQEQPGKRIVVRI